ncbi:MAG: hypothetical protein CSB49_08075 [Proteobacteria bacterium]|nr:MAG: hypothetical protein CSB49_08075 [Pseudomonadota bacterium]
MNETLTDFRIPRLLRPALAQLLQVTCPPDLRELELGSRSAEQAELFLRSLTLGIQVGFCGALSALELSALLRPSSHGRLFSQLPLELAEKHFDTWWRWHGLPHAMAKALKATVVMGFYETREMRERLGYQPDSWIAKVAKRRMQSYAGEIERHQRELFAPDPLPPESSSGELAEAADELAKVHAIGGAR